jgi:TATA-box binding protein (TBP) (component of TFIID and TFIIIB)
VLLFRSKRWVCTGATHPDEALMCILRASSDIRNIYSWFPNPSCEIQNIVASARLFPRLGGDAPTVNAEDAGLLSECDMSTASSADLSRLAHLGRAPSKSRKRRKANRTHQPLPLQEITQQFGLEGNYRPELFPGAIIRVDGICFLVFDSGACVITGAKRPRQMAAGYRNFLWNISARIYSLSKSTPAMAWARGVISPWLLRLLKHADLTKTLDPLYPPVPRIVSF